jgi:hypothetical protein
MRRVLLVVTILFILALTAATLYDIIHNGFTPLDLVSLMILGFFSVAIVGALREPPRE